MIKIKILLLLPLFMLLSIVNYSQESNQYIYTDIQVFDSQDNKMKLDNHMKKMLGEKFYITELDNTLIFSKDANHTIDKAIYSIKENNIKSRVYYQEDNRTYAKLTIYLSLFSNKIEFEINHKFSEVKKIIVKAKEI
jgi:hypothetical protein